MSHNLAARQLPQKWEKALLVDAIQVFARMKFKDEEIAKVAVIDDTGIGYASQLDIPSRIMMGHAWLSNCAASNGGAAIFVMLSHEIAHLYQYKTQMYESMTSDGSVMIAELHADFMAGWVASKVDFLGGMDLAEITRMMSIAGDKLPVPWLHHGTPEQRSRAVSEGFREGQRTVLEVPAAADQGRRYVERMLG
jgi:hypothetical protein